MKRNLLLIFIFFLFLQHFAVAQISDDQQRQLKYWYYRERLRTKFMLDIGAGHGESIPASFRTDFHPTPGGTWEEGADGTITLSYYIIALVTEYDLLTQNGQNTDATLNELYYAVEAINRLDHYCESWWGFTTSLNGFLMREDLCFNCWDDALHQKNNTSYQSVIDHLNNKSQNSRIDNLGAMWIASKEHMLPEFEMSIDQVLHLYMALNVLINKMPSSVSPSLNFMDGPYSFSNEAKEIMKRIIDYIHHSGTLVNTPWNWRIYDPTGTPTLNGTASAYLQAPALSFANLNFANHNNPTKIIKTADQAWKKLEKVYKYMVGAPFVFWSSQGLKFLECLTFSGPYYVNNNHVLPFGAKINLYSTDLSHKHPRVDLPLLNQYLYGIADWHGNPYYRNLLDEAPCYGPYNFSEDCNTVLYQSYNWSSSTLLVEPERRGECDPDFPGEYHGLDYMVLYNLVCLTKNEPTKKYFYDLYNNTMITDFPTLSNYGSSSDPADIISHNTITASNHISNSGDVEYRAGKSIDLTTNFTVDAQANFYAHIDDVECVDDGDVFERKLSAKSISNSVLSNLKQQKNVNINFEATAFPVPFNENINLNLSIEMPCWATIELRSIEGKLIKILSSGLVSESNSLLSFSTEALDKGFYLVTVEINGKTKSLKLIKSK
ncbi:MAG: T9SS type A sorting domain-containing protein [Bacteroidetes bacterium]|nr:T9SS type A sorting domain-containing protein [Bacteroidota bacterium]